MEDKKKIAEKEARDVMEWYFAERKKISNRYKNLPGIDKGSIEQSELISQAHNKIQEIKRKYNID